jgi:hypothetical protein
MKGGLTRNVKKAIPYSLGGLFRGWSYPHVYCDAWSSPKRNAAAKDKIDERVTDKYGDFKFDNLKENSGKYTLRIAYTGYDTKTIGVDLKKSLNAGTIYL